MMAKLALYLLGPVHVQLDKAAIEVKPRKALALLIYLAVTAERHSRDSLATMFWPRSDQRRARHSLRSRLSELNQILGDGWLEADRESVGLREGYWLDVIDFQRMLTEQATDQQSLIAAVDLYRNDFLTGFTLPDCPEFDEWQFFLTESLRQALALALERLVGLLNDPTDYKTAISYARRWLALDPLHEPAHRQLMVLYARTGQRAAALRQYDQCRQTLDEELGISPSQETTALYTDIQAKEVVYSQSKPQPQHNLPTQTTTFIGREAELAEIKRLLLDEPGCRLLNLVGPGGIGKTRLALATAGQSLDAFSDGACFVSLAPVSEVEDIVPTIAEALHFTFYGDIDPKDQLLDYLSHKEMLLVIDNFEHLLHGAGLLAKILRQATEVILLTTSRERLNLQEEWIYDVQGLTFPTAEDKAFTDLDEYSAVELFTQRARQVDAHFRPSAAEMNDIGQICRLVEGMPLGLELAAPWIKLLSCQEIVAEIERSLDFLTSPLKNVPERHRSLRAVFDQTWRRLSQAEKTILSHLSVFRGGCTREAAEQVTGATLPVLSSLVDKALLRRTNLGRYELHELIRQFAEAQLQNDPLAVESLNKRHRDYFVAFLETRAAGVKGHGQKQTLAEIKADMDNVRLVWRWAVANRDAEAIERSAECLFIYYLFSSGHYEGQVAFQQAVAAFTHVSGALTGDDLSSEMVILDQQENLAGFLLTGQGYFLARTHDPQSGQILLRQAIALLRRAEPRDRYKEAFAQLWLGWAIYLQGKSAEAQKYVARCLTFFSEAGDPLGEAWTLLLWSNCTEEGRPIEAEKALRRALVVCQESGDKNNLGYTLHNLASIATFLGRYSEAQEYIDRAIRLFEEMDNILGLGYALRNQGQLANTQGEFEQAVQVLQQAEACFHEVRTERNIINCQVELGTALRLQGDNDQAERLYERLLAATKAMGDHRNIALCLTGLGCLAYGQGEPGKAELFLIEALEIWQQLSLQARIADVLRHLGWVVAATGEQRYYEARQYFRNALDLATEQQVAPIALDVCVGIAQSLLRQTDGNQAVKLLILAEQHESSTFETKEKARHYLAEFTSHLSSEVERPVQDPGQDLWTTAQELVAQLAGGDGHIGN